MSDVDELITPERQVLIRKVEVFELLAEQRPVTELLTLMEQGPPGPPGKTGNDGGAVIDFSGALLVVNQLREFDTESKQAAARVNLGLAVIDGGTYF